MANQEKRVPDITVANTIATGDFVVAVANTGANLVMRLVPVSGIPLAVSAVTPANSTSLTIPGGQFWTDGNYIYVATANNTVKRLGANGQLVTF